MRDPMFGDVRSALQRGDMGALVALQHDTGPTRRRISLSVQAQDYMKMYFARHGHLAAVYEWGEALYQSLRFHHPLAPPGILMEYVQHWCAWAKSDDLTKPCDLVLCFQWIPGDRGAKSIKASRMVGIAMRIGGTHKAWSSGKANHPLWSIYEYDEAGNYKPWPLAVYLHGERVDLNAIDKLDYTYNREHYGITIPRHPRTSKAHASKKRQHTLIQETTP